MHHPGQWGWVGYPAKTHPRELSVGEERGISLPLSREGRPVRLLLAGKVSGKALCVPFLVILSRNRHVCRGGAQDVRDPTATIPIANGVVYAKASLPVPCLPPPTLQIRDSHRVSTLRHTYRTVRQNDLLTRASCPLLQVLRLDSPPKAPSRLRRKPLVDGGRVSNRGTQAQRPSYTSPTPTPPVTAPRRTSSGPPSNSGTPPPPHPHTPVQEASPHVEPRHPTPTPPPVGPSGGSPGAARGATPTPPAPTRDTSMFVDFSEGPAPAPSPGPSPAPAPNGGKARQGQAPEDLDSFLYGEGSSGGGGGFASGPPVNPVRPPATGSGPARPGGAGSSPVKGPAPPRGTGSPAPPPAKGAIVSVVDGRAVRVSCCGGLTCGVAGVPG
jgi:hypothetical protein